MIKHALSNTKNAAVKNFPLKSLKELNKVIIKNPKIFTPKRTRYKSY